MNLVQSDLSQCWYTGNICVSGWRCLVTDAWDQSVRNLRGWLSLRRCVDPIVCCFLTFQIVFKSKNKLVFSHGSWWLLPMFVVCRRQQCDPTLWRQCWGTSLSLRSAMTVSLSCKKSYIRISAGCVCVCVCVGGRAGVCVVHYNLSFNQWNHWGQLFYFSRASCPRQRNSYNPTSHTDIRQMHKMYWECITTYRRQKSQATYQSEHVHLKCPSLNPLRGICFFHFNEVFICITDI